jgi:hypothetical protein
MPATAHPTSASANRFGPPAQRSLPPGTITYQYHGLEPRTTLSAPIYAQRTLPTHTIKEGTLDQYVHSELSGYLDFWMYEQPAFKPVPSGEPENGVELFFGGLWGHISSGVLQWLVNRFGHGAGFHDASGHNIVTKKRPNDLRFRGCAHIRVDTDEGTDLEDVMANLHCCVLFDRKGAWVARSETQKEHLAAYCATLKALTSAALAEKVQGLPSHALTCELAKRRTSYPPESTRHKAIASTSATQPAPLVPRCGILPIDFSSEFADNE